MDELQAPTEASAAPTTAPAQPTQSEQPDYAAENARLTAELDKQKAAYTELNGKHTDMVRRAELDGKVTDVNLALKVLDPERHLNQDGSINVHAIYGDFPSLAPGTFTPTAPNGGGGVQLGGFYPDDLASAARTGDQSTINSALDTYLKGGRK